MAAEELIKEDAGAKLKAEQAELATKWLKEIGRRREKEAKWRKQAKKVIERYKDERDDEDTIAKFNILWANVEVLKPAIFARMPVPDVRRRYLTQDPPARTAAMILERAISYAMEQYDFKDLLDRCVEDYLLPGRGQAIVCYKPMFERKEVRKPVEPLPVGEDDGAEEKYPDGTQFDEQGAYQTQQQEDKLYEEVYCDYVEWDLFVFGEAKTWSKVPWIATGEHLTKEDIKDECPDFKDLENLSFRQLDTENTTGADQPASRVLVWRLWHKASRKYMIFAEGYKEGPLLISDDPLQLQDFYPMPEPLYALRTNKSWLPRPEYLQYQDQARELDRITNRLKNLIDACKNRGVFDQAMDQIAKISDLVKAPDNTYIPIPNFSQLTDKGGLEACLSSLPLEPIIATIAQLRERGNELIQQIYQIMGISDIVRGASDPNETLGAQQLKAQYSGMRISTRQERFQRFIRDILRIKAELIAEHFDPQTLKLMTGINVIPDQAYQQMKQEDSLEANAVSESEFMQAIQIIKSDKLRGFKVDIETDSTVPVDKDTEQKNRVEFIGAIGQYLQGVIPAVQEGAIPMKVAREGLLFVVRGFKVGTELEEVLEELGENDDGNQIQQMKQQQTQMQAQMQQLQEDNQKLTEQNQQLQAKTEVEREKAQAKAQTDQFSAQQKAQTDSQAAQMDARIAQQKADSDAHIKMLIAQNDVEIKGRELAMDMRLKELEIRLNAQVAAKQAASQSNAAQS